MKRLLNLFRRRALDAELDRELRHHLDALEQEYRAKGLDPADARWAARRDFGNLGRTTQNYRDQRGIPVLESVWNDLRFGVRSLIRTPAVTLTVIATLALGIGANTALYSVIHAVLFQPLPYRDADRLVWMAESYDDVKQQFIRSHQYLGWRDQIQSFDSIGELYVQESATLSGRGDPVPVRAVHSSVSLDQLLGTPPLLGRDFLPTDTSAALISDKLHRQLFGGERSAIGQSITLNTTSYTIVGVLPPGFLLPIPDAMGRRLETDVVISFALEERTRQEGMIPIQLLGRLKPGVSAETARAEIARLRTVGIGPKSASNLARVVVIPIGERILGHARLPLYVLWAAVASVLLIACVNVINLLLARSSARRSETAIRIALGAGSWRLIRQMLAESTILAFAGGAAGCTLAYFALQMIRTASTGIPRLNEAGLNWNVLVFTAVLCLIAGLTAGIMPWLTGAQLNPAPGFRRPRGFRGTLVAAELAVALILLTGAGLMLKSLWVMRSGTAESAPDRVLTARVQLLPPDYSPRPNRIRFWGDAAAQLRSIPGVRSAALFASGGGVVSVSGVPRPSRENAVIGQYFNVTPEFLSASGMRVIAGRWIGEADHRDGAPPTVVVSEAFVRQYAAKYPTPASILGQIIPAGRPSAFETATIVGVVSGFRLRPDADLGPQVFWPYTVSPSAPYESTLLARGSQDPGSLADGVRRAFGRYPRLNLIGIQTLGDQLSGSVAPRRFQAMLMIVFAGLAVVLAMIGTYGVLSFAVTEQTRDIGVRMALGASRPDVLRMVLSRGLRLAAAGAVIGLAGSLALTRLMRSMLYGVEPTDPGTLFIASALLVGVAMLAAYLPARRAVRVDPIQALRNE